MSLRFRVTFVGQPGDSGALVHVPPYGGGPGLGIYLGRTDFVAVAGGPTLTEGYCQNLAQIAQLLKLDLYFF
jgi:hypothetical protein